MSMRAKEWLINAALVGVLVLTGFMAWRVYQGFDALVEPAKMHHFNHGPQDPEPTH
jgi:cytoskeletal protein RodZ